MYRTQLRTSYVDQFVPPKKIVANGLDFRDTYLVPYQNPCPKCAKTGLVRAEHVIRGGIATLAHYCGYCEHQWSVVEAPSARPGPPKYVPLPKPRTRSFGPKRK